MASTFTPPMPGFTLPVWNVEDGASPTDEMLTRCRL
jgi:hypothetical protein